VGITAEAIKDAKDSIRDAGAKVIWRQRGNPVPVVGQEWKAASAPDVDHPVVIAFVPNTRINFEAQRQLQDVPSVKSGAEMGLMAGGQTFTPDSKDVVIRNGVTLQIDAIQIIRPQGIPVLYIVSFKG
jgi:hypothetical protein